MLVCSGRNYNQTKKYVLDCHKEKKCIPIDLNLSLLNCKCNLTTLLKQMPFVFQKKLQNCQTKFYRIKDIKTTILSLIFIMKVNLFKKNFCSKDLLYFLSK